MINLTVDECKNLKLFPLKYEEREKDLRIFNTRMLWEFVNVIKDKECRNFFEISNLSSTQIPKKLITYYNKYYETTDDYPKLISVLKKEYEALSQKILNFAKKWEMEPEYIRNQLFFKQEILFHFIKEPGRQTFHQHLLFNWLKSFPYISNLVELPAGGKNALYIVNGKLITGKQKDSNLVDKSIDISWEYTFSQKKLCFYITHKHTKESGGAQDNQYKDVQHFHQSAKQSVEDNYCFCSITDGSYYNEVIKIKNIELTRIEHLNSSLFKGSRNYATSHTAFNQDTIPFIKKWLQDNFPNWQIKEELLKLKALERPLF